jgi:glycosyltransferase domain-containing protein
MAHDLCLTIMIPTLNRPDFLSRVLSYYSTQSFRQVISICDSSDSQHAIKNQELIKRYEHQLILKYHYCPHFNDSQAIKFMGDTADTPYVVFMADDDLIVPEGLAQCVVFLENNPDYVAAHGDALVFVMKEGGVYGKIKSTSKYSQRSSTEHKAAERLENYLKNYWVPLFSVHRRIIWQRMYRDIEIIKDKAYTELLPSSLSLMLGKHKHLPYLYLMRQAHQQRYFLPNTYDWLMSKSWHGSSVSYVRFLIEALQEIDAMDEMQAECLVKKVHWAYLTKVLYNRYLKMYRHQERSIIEKLRYWLFDDHLIRISNPWHRHYKYFNDVYQLIQSG